MPKYEDTRHNEIDEKIKGALSTENANKIIIELLLEISNQSIEMKHLFADVHGMVKAIKDSLKNG